MGQHFMETDPSGSLERIKAYKPPGNMRSASGSE